MAELTLQVLDGVDRGKQYEHLATPVSIGREEGNKVQLNDERVSRYHAKIHEDQGMLVLTDLESTNGTRINGEPTQVTIVRIGDRISLGRSVLMVGSQEEIESLVGPTTTRNGKSREDSSGLASHQTRPTAPMTDMFLTGEMRSDELKFQLNLDAQGLSPAPKSAGDDSSPRGEPPLPVRLSPAQAAQLSELLAHLHQRISQAVDDENVEHLEDGSVHISKTNWHRIVRTQADLARYIYRIGHPE
jgi:pSer/pThr/pTyr-binding forkhead associated (FHA) protein